MNCAIMLCVVPNAHRFGPKQSFTKLQKAAAETMPWQIQWAEHTAHSIIQHTELISTSNKHLNHSLQQQQQQNLQEMPTHLFTILMCEYFKSNEPN